MIHPIEQESYEILRGRIDLSHRSLAERAVVERIIHASGDTEFATTTVVRDGSVEAGVAALRRECAVVVDVEMVRAGITGYRTECRLRDTQAMAGGTPTRSALALRSAATAHPRGAIFVIGCAPTALFELLEMARAGDVAPALVIGLPVGFVGAAAAKEALRSSGLPAISNVGDKGGSAVAAAAFNAVLRLSQDQRLTPG